VLVVTLYDRIGRTYASIRRADPRLAAAIWAALGDARTVVNVGAGTGSYEPTDRSVTAVEPSAVMIAQRPKGSAPAVQASAEELPFAGDSFDAAMAILTLHHWQDIEAGLHEMARVARRRVVVLTFDPAAWRDQWIFVEYLPELMEGLESYPSPQRVLEVLPNASVEVLPAPNDCTDRMFATLWARPEQYLDPAVRAATSVWYELPEAVSARALEQLRLDLEAGLWDRRHGNLRRTPEWDVGLRLVRAEL
jgi:SAM-dependent methyltransferase